MEIRRNESEFWADGGFNEKKARISPSDWVFSAIALQKPYTMLIGSLKSDIVIVIVIATTAVQPHFISLASGH